MLIPLVLIPTSPKANNIKVQVLQKAMSNTNEGYYFRSVQLCNILIINSPQGGVEGGTQPPHREIRKGKASLYGGEVRFMLVPLIIIWLHKNKFLWSGNYQFRDFSRGAYFLYICVSPTYKPRFPTQSWDLPSYIFRIQQIIYITMRWYS